MMILIRMVNYLINIDLEEKFKAVYSSCNLDLNKEDMQFNKYKLLTFTGDMNFLNTEDTRIYDSRINKTIFLEISKYIRELLQPLIENNIIKKIAFRPKFTFVKDGKHEIENIFEVIEYGRTFEFECFRNIPVTKLIDYETKNSLWIKSDKEKNWITFEEMLSDFEIDENGSAITQIVHLEYTFINMECFITHLDHEIVFYTYEEYCNRLNRSNQKGTNKSREKTFKIDGSKIPFKLEDGRIFLFEVLEILFTNKELLKEYFEKLI